MRSNQFTVETAQKLSEKLNVPAEQIMHTPPHLIKEKIAEWEEKEIGKSPYKSVPAD